ncbi:MAG: AMP-binding protein [Eubacterium sp.]|nr:AMP-binding protein [Eubacterium sp.]
MWDLKKFSSSPALTGEDGSVITYEDLITEGDKIYNAIGRRCLVFCMCRNELGSILGYVSFLEHGVVPVLLSASIDKELLNHLLEVYKPSFIWSPVTDSGFESKYSAYGYTLYSTGFEGEYDLNDELGLLLTTSGSTGSPKLVRQSYKNILANAVSIAQYLELSADERPITTLPMNYTYGLSIINSHLLVGANILVTEKGLMQKDFWTFFKTQEATSFGGVPYTYEMLEKLRFFRMDLPSLRYMTQAGGKLTVELHKKCAEYAAEKGKKFIVMYGQCEATARMGYLPADQALAKIGSMGIAIPGGTFYLYDEKDKTITEPDVTGELIYEGENVTLGYAEKGEDLSLGDERHGVLHTGDMAKRDTDGFYYIVGRKKRFLKIYGNRVNLDEVERLIKGHFGVSDAACGGVDDHMFLFVTDESIAEEVKKFVAAKTGLNPVAFKTVVIDEIPKNDSGKTLYRGLEKYYGIAD